LGAKRRGAKGGRFDGSVLAAMGTRVKATFVMRLSTPAMISVVVVMLDSVRAIRVVHHELLIAVEWFFTILFTIEYLQVDSRLCLYLFVGVPGM
jgi:hypothetical protein